MMRQPFHLVDYSPWPFTASMGALTLTVGLVAWFQGISFIGVALGMIIILLTLAQWWRDVIREATYQGHHTQQVMKGLRWGMILFIASEAMFFLAFFWAFFHSSLAPTPELGCVWPPVGITIINPFSVPLLNTAILLASGVTITWAHHSLMESDLTAAKQALTITVLLGAYFSYLQLGEYWEAPFTIADSIYGTTFFVATGFHGLHVIIGSLFLAVCNYRLFMNHFSPSRHLGFEAAAWYWHFVDVIWIFLYICIYWWGS